MSRWLARAAAGAVLASSVVAPIASADETPVRSEVPTSTIATGALRSGSSPIDAELAVDIARDHVVRSGRPALVADGDASLRGGPLARSSSDVETGERPAADDLAVDSVVPSAHTGLTNVHFQQQRDGIDIRGAVVNVGVSSAGEVLTEASRLRPVGGERRSASSSTPSLDSISALHSAADALGLTPVGEFRVVSSTDGADRRHVLSDGGVSRQPITARLVWEPVDADTLRLAWEFLVDAITSDHWWRIRIDADTGAELSRFDLVVHETGSASHDDAVQGDHDLVTAADRLVEPPDVTAAGPEDAPIAARRVAPSTTGSRTTTGLVADGSSYRAFPFSPVPIESPVHGTRALISDPADATASPFGWHDTDGRAGADTRTTVGNNVAAGTDLDGDDVVDPRGRPVSASLDFDFPFDPTDPPSAYRPAAVTNLFVWNNLVHDFLYRYGFDEAAGNFQQNNYGRGGHGGDAVIADAQDGSGLLGSRRTTDNANFATPPDGTAPRMQTYVFTSSDPERDSDLSGEVIAHEYAHGLSTRLTGGPAYDECLDNDEQMGEGWSDVIALLMTMRGESATDRTRGIGTYVSGQPSDGPGIRGRRYSTGGPSGTNPWDYDTIRFTGGSPHALGAVWAQMLWEMTWMLVDDHGFDPDLVAGNGGNNIATQLIVDGMKLQPCEPGFVDARDAILQADAIANDGRNVCTIWAAFALRGLGYSATQGDTDDRRDGASATDVPPSCGRAGTAALAVGAPAAVVAGDEVEYTLVARNDLGVGRADIALATPVPSGSTYVAGSATCGGAVTGGVVEMTVTLAPGATRSCTFRVRTDPTRFGGTVFFDDMNAGLGAWRATAEPGSQTWERHDFSGDDSGATMRTTETTSDQFLTLRPAFPVAENTVFSFIHEYDFEGGFDGGVIEISTDRGRTWKDLGPHIVANGYDAPISSEFASPIGGRPAFTGNGGPKVTEVDLASFAGSEVRVRFRGASDRSTGSGTDRAWTVDDVRLENTEVSLEVESTMSSTRIPATSAVARTRVDAPESDPPPLDVFEPLTPARLLDTRPDGETIDGREARGGRRGAGATIVVPVAGRAGIPSDAVAAVVNVTAVQPGGVGYFTVHPCLSPMPVASSLNFVEGVNLGNEIIAQLDGDGDLCVFTSAATHVTVDAVGYVLPGTAYGSVQPTRLIDTREGAVLGAGEEIELDVSGRAGVPSGAGSVVINVAAIRPSSTGFLTVHPCLASRPTTSSLNYIADTTRGNEIVAEVDGRGKLCIFTSSQTHLSVDVVGHLPADGAVSIVDPARLVDTRPSGETIDGLSAGSGTAPAGSTTRIPVAGRGGVAVDALGAVVNVTAVQPAGPGFLTVWACDAVRPNASSLNYVRAVNGGNEIVAGLSDSGDLCVYTSAATDLTVDVTASI